jgi:hypothetical protein
LLFSFFENIGLVLAERVSRDRKASKRPTSISPQMRQDKCPDRHCTKAEALHDDEIDDFKKHGRREWKFVD